jgi:hypothetical protein
VEGHFIVEVDTSTVARIRIGVLSNKGIISFWVLSRGQPIG